MSRVQILAVIVLVGVWSVAFVTVAWASDKAPPAPAVDYAVPLEMQPFASDPQVIWYDSFDEPDAAERYMEYGSADGLFGQTTEEALGGRGQSLRAVFQEGAVEAGGLKLTFGDWPAGRGPQARPGEQFTTVYWRLYVKHESGWVGNPAKLSRAMVMAGGNWSQAMIAHVWGGPGDVLTLDPASGTTPAGELVTTRYNDFANIRWLGNRPASTYPIFATSESGKWVCVEAAATLNTPGQADGTFLLWIDGRLDAVREGLNWTGSWRERGINAVFLENYWNDGSPVEQARYFDDFVVSTQPIGLARNPLNPVVVKTPFSSQNLESVQSAWQMQVARDNPTKELVWDSDQITGDGDSVAVTVENGRFLGHLSGQTALLPDTRYLVRVRQRDDQGLWSKWSPWRLVIHTEALP